LVDSGCTHTRIDEQLVKKEKIKMEPMDRSFKIFNTDRTKNGEVIRFVPLEVEIDGHKEQINAAVMDLNGMDMFLGYGWLVKCNPEVDWSKETMKFTRCPRMCMMNHQNISFTPKIWRTQTIEDNNKGQQEVRKKSDLTNPENLPDYIRPFTHLFNKKKFEKLPDKREWDHEINLTEETPKELNVKAYAMTIKEEEALNQWLDKQLKAELIKELKSRYAAPCFYILKKNGSL